MSGKTLLSRAPEGRAESRTFTGTKDSQSELLTTMVRVDFSGQDVQAQTLLMGAVQQRADGHVFVHHRD